MDVWNCTFLHKENIQNSGLRGGYRSEGGVDSVDVGIYYSNNRVLVGIQYSCNGNTDVWYTERLLCVFVFSRERPLVPPTNICLTKTTRRLIVVSGYRLTAPHHRVIYSMPRTDHYSGIRETTGCPKNVHCFYIQSLWIALLLTISDLVFSWLTPYPVFYSVVPLLFVLCFLFAYVRRSAGT